MQQDISHITIPEVFNTITDFYLPVNNPLDGFFYPGAFNVKSHKGLYDIVQLLTDLSNKISKTDYSLRLTHEGKNIVFRGHIIESIEGKLFILRRLPSFIPKINDLGIQQNIMDLIAGSDLNSGGLIIIAGETGQGKSTTAASAIAHRLKKYGSFCLTIEDPIELPLQGVYCNEDESKRGLCYQTEVEENNIEECIRGAMRCFPSISNSILFLGETRDNMMASEVIKIAANGHLVITTFHGSDLITSLKRFLSMATSYKNNNKQEIESMFSSVFKLILHQKLVIMPNKNKQIEPKILYSNSNTSKVANQLKTGTIDHLITEIQSQNLMVLKGAKLNNG